MSLSLPALDALYEDYAARVHSPGLAAGVVVGGELAWCKSLGVADLAGGRPVRPDTRFRIASMSKNVCGLAILMLRDGGDLSLEAPVGEYVPELARLPLPTADSRPITVRDLLTHTAGLVTDDPWADRQLGMAPADFTRLLQAGRIFAQAPGVAFEYSNLGYAILGRVITNVSGQPYQRFVTEALLKPLGMAATTYDAFAAPKDLRAAGYRWALDRWTLEPDEPDGEFGIMGGLVTTAEDYARFVAFLLDAWPARDDPDEGPVRRASVRELGLVHAPPARGLVRDRDAGEVVASGYGYGLVNSVHPELGRYLHHLGGLPGYGSHVLIGPETGVGIFCFANRTYAAPDGVNVAAAKALREAGLWKPREKPVSPALRAAAEAVVQAYNAGRIETIGAELAVNLLPDEPAAERDAVLEALKASFGRARLEAFEPRHDLAGRFVLRCEAGAVRGEVVLTPGPEPKIQKLVFDEPA